MHEHGRRKEDPITEFGARLSASLEQGTFVRLVLSGAGSGEGSPEKVLGRRVDLKGKPHLSLTFRYATRDEVRNLPIGEAESWLVARFGSEFRNALLGTTERDWQLSVSAGKPARLVSHKPLSKVVPAPQHDHSRRLLLDDSARDWLTGLGVLDPNGCVRPAMADKHTQINRYLEIFSHLARDVRWIGTPAETVRDTEWTIADMGSGKGYLTFGLWHLWRRIWELPVQVIGVEARPDLVVQTNGVATSIQAEGLTFIHGNIESAALPKICALIALHACNTATDYAIQRGIDLGAQLIVLAPCCHKELRAQLHCPGPLGAVLRHGIMEERMAEWATDGLRALFLEWAGYRTKVFEFVSSEHTAKNLMIAAVRDGSPFADASARARVLEFKAFFGIRSHTLDPLLDERETES